MNTHIFRAYDIRGLADSDLTDEVVRNVGKAYGTTMKRSGGRVVSVGRDVRHSSERIEKALVEGILSTGVNVIRIGMVTTPMTYYSIILKETDGSVMVTGSHNPIEFNGLKLNRGLLSLHGEQIQDLRQLIEAGDYEEGSGNSREEKIDEAYKEMLLGRITLKRPFKVVVDAGNGTAGPVAPEVLRRLGCEVICLFCEPDGRFPNHLPDPTVMEYIQDLRQKVLEENADFGLGYDGDSDRVGLIDDKGRVVFADQILALLSGDVLDRNPGASILFDVKCSKMLPEIIEKFGGKPVMYKTGHSLIKARMREVNAPLAGEMSGHIFFKDGFFGYDDGIYVSLRVAQFLAGQDRPLSEIVDQLPHYHSTPEIRIPCPDEDKFDVVRQLTEEFKKEYPVVDVDGARVQFQDGWGLVRVSNTQPILVLRFEASTPERLKEIQDVFKNRLAQFKSVDISDL